ncbi:uncharacterized protein CXQ87_002524 [Candidozyma duobushaemuli]|uniref:Uncharacterized protein n=2 Tax=Candidozyma TaxID=3303203 RepID=A0ABX8I2G0_9ASCO|nr:uncharacterized protein CXQ87_002524 [[Candida] duobushaemulonis]PVH14391.1 hypothetical protein CXQ87_002524 [[Candida] duobushaemulonis]QWU87436.1 hypothetical protein CA3LBN_001701 [[Candida] haemuloni]
MHLSDTDFPSFGKPFTEHVYKDGNTISCRRKFTFPFKLEHRYDYLLWLHGVLREVRRVLGPDEFNYILRYLIDGEDAAKESLPKEHDSEKISWIIHHCDQVARELLFSGLSERLHSIIPCCSSDMEKWRQMHQRSFKFRVSQFVEYICKWADKLAIDAWKGKSNSWETMSCLDANSFTKEELYFMMFFNSHENVQETTIKEYFKNLGVEEINLADRVTTSFASNKMYPDALTATCKYNEGCTHCWKKSHGEEDCWVKYPHLRPRPVSKRKANDESRNCSKRQKKSKTSSPEKQTFDVDLAGSKCRSKITFVWSTRSTRHVVKDRNLLYDFVKNRQVLKDFFGNKTVSEGYGKLSGIAANGQRIVLEKVFYLKNAPANIIAGNQPIAKFAHSFSQKDLALTDEKGRRLNTLESDRIALQLHSCLQVAGA